MSRPRIFLAFAVSLALAGVLAACGGGGGGSEDPQAVLDEATLQGVESGNLDLSVGVDVKGSEGGHIDVSLSGPFQSEGPGQLPRLDLAAKAKGQISGEGVDFEGGLILLPGKAYVGYEGTEYEVDPTTFGFVKSAIERAQKRGGGQQGATACQEAAGKLKVSEFAENLSSGGSADVGGTSTTKISGDLDVSGAIDSFVELAEDPACSAQLGAAGSFPSPAEIEKAKGEVESALKQAHVEVYVGDDHVVRRIAAQLAIEPQRSGSGPESVDVELDLTLTGVNEEQAIAAPQGAKPLNDLFLKLGINPIELLGLLNGGSGGLGSLLNQAGGGGSSAEGGGSSAGGSAGSRQAYLECIRGASSAADIQNCAGLLQ